VPLLQAVAQPAEPTVLPSIEVIGTAIGSDHDVSQSVDTVDNKELAEQNLTLLQDALRNVPGITLNSGEGGAHGDSVNLRGLSIPDSFFLDGVRDIGQYQRDTFNSDAISVLLGPASALFGRGSTSGVINSISKQPLLTPLAALSVSAGQADFWRGTADLNLPLGDTAAARLTVMDQHNHVVERDQVTYNRYGVAPTLAFGIDTPTRLTLSYFKEVENNLPDYGIPFIDGAPAQVDRSNFYGLVNYDRTRTNNSIGTVRFEHDFADGYTISDSLRYATYGFEYLVTGSFLGNDFVPPPPPGTPLADIEVSRDQPSSGGDTNMVINRTDLTRKFDWQRIQNTLTGGLELSKESRTSRGSRTGWTISRRRRSWRPTRSIRRPRRWWSIPRRRAGATTSVCTRPTTSHSGPDVGSGRGAALGSLLFQLQRTIHRDRLYAHRCVRESRASRQSSSRTRRRVTTCRTAPRTTRRSST
jgi:catecholate siderophore receptor